MNNLTKQQLAKQIEKLVNGADSWKNGKLADKELFGISEEAVALSWLGASFKNKNMCLLILILRSITGKDIRNDMEAFYYLYQSLTKQQFQQMVLILEKFDDIMDEVRREKK